MHARRPAKLNPVPREPPVQSKPASKRPFGGAGKGFKRSGMV